MTTITDAKCNFYLSAAFSAVLTYTAPQKVARIFDAISNGCLNETSLSTSTPCSIDLALSSAYLGAVTTLFGLTIYYGHKFYKETTISQNVTCLGKTN